MTGHGSRVLLTLLAGWYSSWVRVTARWQREAFWTALACSASWVGVPLRHENREVFFGRVLRQNAKSLMSNSNSATTALASSEPHQAILLF